MNMLYHDLLDNIYSFLIPKIENDELILTNDIILLNLSSKYINTTIEHFLKKYYNCYKIKYINSINYASKNGHINVLEWFKSNEYEFKYDETAINYASKNGHVNVLEWFKNSEYEFKYDENAINYASKNGHVNVLEWFKNSEYEFKYCINYIKRLKNIDILYWFKNKEYNFGEVSFFTVKYKRHTNFVIENIYE